MMPVAPESVGDDGFAALMEKVARERGFRCASYKERCLKRRVGVRMRTRGVLRYADYARLLDDDVSEYDRLIATLTINVTRLFRNCEAFDAIAQAVVPPLWEREGDQPLRVWSAGCAAGHEPYSLATLFHRHAESTGTIGRLSRLCIVGTDVDAAVLVAAERAEFEESDFAETPPDVRARYFGSRAPFPIDADVRRLVSFRRADLLSDAPPFPQPDLIVCRNVLIYFDRASQDRLLRMFHDALAPGGFLVLGKVETPFGATRGMFTAVRVRERVFRRA